MCHIEGKMPRVHTLGDLLSSAITLIEWESIGFCLGKQDRLIFFNRCWTDTLSIHKHISLASYLHKQLHTTWHISCRQKRKWELSEEIISKINQSAMKRQSPRDRTSPKLSINSKTTEFGWTHSIEILSLFCTFPESFTNTVVEVVVKSSVSCYKCWQTAEWAELNRCDS